MIAQLFPRALLSHRSALEYKPTETGEIYISSNTNREVAYPGLKLVFLRSRPPLPSDPAFAGFKVSSLPRALMENLSSRGPKSLPPEDIEKKLASILGTKGEAELNRIRDEARTVAEALGWKREIRKQRGSFDGAHLELTSPNYSAEDVPH